MPPTLEGPEIKTASTEAPSRLPNLGLSPKAQEALTEYNKLEQEKRLDTTRGITVGDAIRGRELKIILLQETGKNTPEKEKQIQALRGELQGLFTIQRESSKYAQPVKIINTDPGVAASVIPGFSQYTYCSANPDDLANLDWVQVMTHERTHLHQFNTWGTMTLPGFDKIDNSYLVQLLSRHIGVSVSASAMRKNIEGFTEQAATRIAGFNEDCAYNYDGSVRGVKQMSDFVFRLTGQNLLELFTNMRLHEFENALITTINILVLADAARTMVKGPLTSEENKKLILIGKDRMNHGDTLSSQEAAKEAIKKASPNILELSEHVGGRVTNILVFTPQALAA